MKLFLVLLCFFVEWFLEVIIICFKNFILDRVSLLGFFVEFFEELEVNLVLYLSDV